MNKFISFEGCEGSGKSTQITKLTSFLRDQGEEVILTREPGGTPTGELIRNILQHDAAGEPVSPMAEALLFAASRAQHVDHVIRPALEEGKWVICDRFVDSSIAYQGSGRDLGQDEIMEINHHAIRGCMPALTFVFDIPIDVAFERMAKRHVEESTAADRIESEEAAFHESVRAAYLQLAESNQDRIRLIDGTKDQEVIFTQIKEHLGLIQA